MAAEQPGRLAHLDGLRGIAIGSVLLFHAWGLRGGFAGGGGRADLVAPLVSFAKIGYQGVALFLVLSGFCLSYPLLVRRQQGTVRWFQPVEFFARRCWRILPAYYVALACWVIFWEFWARVRPHHLVGAAPVQGTGDVLTHVLLIHNLTQWHFSINAAFWSLGLEWQWYWAFPIALWGCIHRSRLTLVATAILMIGWHVVTRDLWTDGSLPARLFEFCCGVAAATMVVEGRVPPRRLLWPSAVIALLVGEFWHVTLANTLFGAAEPMVGIASAAVILLAQGHARIERVLAVRPLAWLGAISYSVYLMHMPVELAVDSYVQLPRWAATPKLGLAMAMGILVGYLFFHLVERPAMRRDRWQRVAPYLRRALGWTRPLALGMNRARPGAQPAEIPTPVV